MLPISRSIAALAMAVALPACAINPTDNGTSGYTYRIYVDNTYTTCITPGQCGTQLNPFTDIQVAINQVKPGTEVIVGGHSGSPYYQGWLNFPASPNSNPARILVRAWQGTGMTTPIIRGTQKVTNWTNVGTATDGSFLYKTPWAVPDENNPNVVQEPEQVFRDTNATDARSLKQIGGRVYKGYPDTVDPALSQQATGFSNIWPGRTPGDKSTLKANQFWFERGEKNYLWVALDRALALGESLEVSRNHFLVTGNGTHNLEIRNLAFERSNTSHYWRGGAIYLTGNSIFLNTIQVRYGDSHCIQIGGKNNTIYNSTIEYCGQTGVMATGSAGSNGQAEYSDFWFYGNTVRYNNTRGFEPHWEAGGIKIISQPYLINATFSNNTIAHNKGHGLWFDTYINNNTIDNNIIAFNTIGLFLEISNGNKVTNNQIFGNTAQGIQLKGANTTIQGNFITGNGLQGLAMPPDNRPLSPTETVYDPKGNTIAANKFAFNFDSSYTFEIDARANSKIDKNRYCSRSPYMAKEVPPAIPDGSATIYAAYDLPTWRSWGYDLDSSSVRVVTNKYQDGYQDGLKGKMTRQEESLITDARNNQLNATISSLCGW